ISGTTTSSIASNSYIYGGAITIAVGIIGHICSLLTFSRRVLRHVSTSMFFMVLAVSDLIYVLMSIYDFVMDGLQITTSTPYYVEICRLRGFINGFSMIREFLNTIQRKKTQEQHAHTRALHNLTAAKSQHPTHMPTKTLTSI
ncbi:unnamed protein product, partial [Didymodactylos carnosus]